MSVNPIGNNLGVRAEFQKTPIAKAEQKAEVPVRLTNSNDGGATSVNLSETSSSKNLISSDLQGKMKLQQVLQNSEGASNSKQVGERIRNTVGQMGEGARHAAGRIRREADHALGRLNSLNDQEVLFFIAHDRLLPAYINATILADNYDTANAKNLDGPNGRFNAVKHSYWSALMTRDGRLPGVNNISQSAGLAREYGIAHEANEDQTTQLGRLQRGMDLFNNRVGRIIAMNNPSASNERLLQLCEDAAREGDLAYIKDSGTSRQRVVRTNE